MTVTPGVTRVEWVGGPMDGEVHDYPPGIHVIRIALTPTRQQLWAGGSELSDNYIELPIQQRPDGRLYVQFHYPPKEAVT